MMVPVFRMMAANLDPTGRPVGSPWPIYFFEPEDGFEPDPGSPIHPGGWPGTGTAPWATIEVPDGSRLDSVLVEDEAGVVDEDDVETVLVLPDGEMLDTSEAFRRFADPALVRSEREIAEPSPDSTSPGPGTD